MKNAFFVVFLFFFSCYLLKSTVIVDTVMSFADDRSKLGLLGGYRLNNNISDFRQLPGVSYFAPRFSSAEGNGIKLGLLYESSVSKKYKFSYILRLFYTQDKAFFTKDEVSKEFIDNTELNANINYQINSLLIRLIYENLLSFRLIGNLNLLAGFNIGIFLKSNADQKETLLDPPTGNFTNGSRTRHELSGPIKNLSTINSAISCGLNYNIKIGSKEEWILSPEILYSYSVSKVTTVIDWKYHTLNFNFAIKYSPAPTDRILDYQEEIKSDTVKISSDTVSVTYFKFGKELIKYDTLKSVNTTVFFVKKTRTDTLFIPELFETPEMVISYDSNGTTKDLKSIFIEEYLNYYQMPLLSYIFFDEMSDTISNRYKKLNSNEKTHFNNKSLHGKNVIQSYSQILNLIGYRMLVYPESTITLTGCNSGSGDEYGNIDLSQKRAYAVARYLKEVWEIDETRIMIKCRNLPEKYSNINDPDGEEENRRVEITSDEPEITRFFSSIDTMHNINPRSINVDITKKNSYDIYYVSLVTDSAEIFSLGSSILTFSNIGNRLPKNIDNIKISVNGIINRKHPYKSGVRVFPIIRSEQKLIDSTANPQVETYNLILFDFNKHTLRDEQKSVLNQIKNRLNEFNCITIYGYTDKSGDEDYNLKLSQKRAQEVADYLNFENTIVKGFGETKLLYDNSTPEGRFYSRTVIIELQK